MSIENLYGYSDDGASEAEVWILRDADGQIIAFTMRIFTNCS